MAEPNMMDDMLARITKEIDKAEKKLKDFSLE